MWSLKLCNPKSELTWKKALVLNTNTFYSFQGKFRLVLSQSVKNLTDFTTSQRDPVTFDNDSLGAVTAANLQPLIFMLEIANGSGPEWTLNVTAEGGGVGDTWVKQMTQI